MNKRERFKLSVAVFIILLDQDTNQVLLLKRSNTGWLDGYFSIPAGTHDGNEPIHQAAIREAREEVGVEINEADIQMVHTLHSLTEGEEWVGLFFLINKWNGVPKVNEPHKHSEVKWAGMDVLPTNLISYVKQAIELYGNNINYSIYGW